MGKQRRNRAKFHAAAPKAPQETICDAVDSSDKMSVDGGQSVGKLSFKVQPKGGVFDGVDIAVSNLNTFLADDTKSVHSLAKTFKSVKRSLGGKSLKKDEKKKLRHDMFLSKIDAFYKHRETLKKKNKRQPAGVSIQDLDNALPSVDMLFHQSGKKTKQPRPVSTKQKGIKKAKLRQKESERNFDAFKTIMQAAKSKDTGLLQDLVGSHIEKKLIGTENGLN